MEDQESSRSQPVLYWNFHKVKHEMEKIEEGKPVLDAEGKAVKETVEIERPSCGSRASSMPARLKASRNGMAGKSHGMPMSGPKPFSPTPVPSCITTSGTEPFTDRQRTAFTCRPRPRLTMPESITPRRCMNKATGLAMHLGWIALTPLLVRKNMHVKN